MNSFLEDIKVTISSRFHICGLQTKAAPEYLGCITTTKIFFQCLFCLSCNISCYYSRISIYPTTILTYYYLDALNWLRCLKNCSDKKALNAFNYILYCNGGYENCKYSCNYHRTTPSK